MIYIGKYVEFIWELLGVFGIFQSNYGTWTSLEKESDWEESPDVAV